MSHQDQIRMSDEEAAAFLAELTTMICATLGPGERGFREQASKRVGMRFTPTRVVSWDHSKLGQGVS